MKAHFEKGPHFENESSLWKPLFAGLVGYGYKKNNYWLRQKNEYD
jgi:hypothetical protein